MYEGDEEEEYDDEYDEYDDYEDEDKDEEDYDNDNRATKTQHKTRNSYNASKPASSHTNYKVCDSNHCGKADVRTIGYQQPNNS